MISSKSFILTFARPVKRVDFYGKVHRLLRQHYSKDVKFASYSCYFTEDEGLAKKFLEVVQGFNGKGHIYKAVKMQ